MGGRKQWGKPKSDREQLSGQKGPVGGAGVNENAALSGKGTHEVGMLCLAWFAAEPAVLGVGCCTCCVCCVLLCLLHLLCAAVCCHA